MGQVQTGYISATYHMFASILIGAPMHRQSCSELSIITMELSALAILISSIMTSHRIDALDEVGELNRIGKSKRNDGQ